MVYTCATRDRRVMNALGRGEMIASAKITDRQKLHPDITKGYTSC